MAVLNDDSRTISGLTFFYYFPVLILPVSHLPVLHFSTLKIRYSFSSHVHHDLFDPSFSRVAFSVDQHNVDFAVSDARFSVNDKNQIDVLLINFCST